MAAQTGIVKNLIIKDSSGKFDIFLIMILIFCV